MAAQAAPEGKRHMAETTIAESKSASHVTATIAGRTRPVAGGQGILLPLNPVKR